MSTCWFFHWWVLVREKTQGKKLYQFFECAKCNAVKMEVKDI